MAGQSPEFPIALSLDLDVTKQQRVLIKHVVVQKHIHRLC